MDTKSEKAKMRKAVQLKLKELSWEDRALKSQKIMEKLYDHPIYQDAHILFTYLPFREEVMLDPWIEHAWGNRKQVYVPRINPTTKMMEFYEIKGWEDVERGFYGIREPKQSCPKYDGTSIDLMVVPGVVFAINKYRIGYGAGYYDRFLAQMKELPYLLAPAFDIQIVQEVPMDPWDIPVNEIITESRIIR